MKLPFRKMHGCGNDFVVVEGTGSRQMDWSQLARNVLDRRFGIGADQLVVLLPSEQFSSYVAFFERDGRESEMCGNGIRCVARYLHETGATKEKQLELDTRSGVKKLEIESWDRVRVDMGAPTFEPEKIPLAPGKQIWGEKLVIGEQEVVLYTLSMGNPHAVIFVSNEAQLAWVTRLGPALEHHENFPERTNVEFVWPRDSHNLTVRVWERGAGETLACGTGACAAAVASIREKKAKDPVQIHFTGGTVEVSWKPGESAFLTGPASHVFTGEMEL